MGWSPPNVGYQTDPRTGEPVPTQFDPGKLPEGTPPLYRIIGSHDKWTNQPFLLRDGASGQQGGYAGPGRDPESQ